MNRAWAMKIQQSWRAPMAGVLLLTGCAAQRDVGWTPQPRARWEHIATEPLPPVSDGYQILTPLPTKGLFPASIAVSRVALEPVEGTGGTMRPRLHTDPRNEFLQWNSSFDNLMAVSEVFPIAERTLGGGEAVPEQILAAYRALGARLGLIYAVNELTELETEMMAVLYEIKDARPIASFHARAVSNPPLEAKKKGPPDLWETDSHALVRAELVQLVHSCLRELILNDEPDELEDPSGWKPLRPLHPVEWPPRLFQAPP